MIGRWLDALRARAQPQEDLREALKWFNRFEGPPDELVQWFSAPPTPPPGDDPPEVFTVAAAIERRKWVLRGAAENPDDQHFEGRSNWLPLIAYRGCLLIYESGPARSGLVLRQPDRRERYVKDRTRPMPLATFDLARFGDGGDADADVPPDASLLAQLLPFTGVRAREGEWSPSDRLPFFKDGVPRPLLDWFNAHDGQRPGTFWFPEDRVHAKWRALSLDEAVIARDLLLERAEPALGERLHRDPRWLPLFEVNAGALFVFAEDRGVALHGRAPVPWSRWSPLHAFLDASHEVWAPRRFGTFAGEALFELPDAIVAELQAVTGAFDERMVQREGLSVDDRQLLRVHGLSQELALWLPAWLEANVARPGPPLLAEGEHALSGSEALALRRERKLDRPWFPLARGADGVVIGWVEKVGVAELHPDGALRPIAATFGAWLSGLLHAADAERDARVEPGSIRRSLTGVWTLDVAPLLAKDLVAALGALPWSFTRSGCTLTLERGREVDVRAEAKTRLIIQLPDALIDQMIADLEALDGYEPATLHWEDIHDLVVVVRAKA